MFEYHIDPARQLTCCTVAGSLDFLQVAQSAQRLLEDREASATRHTLFVISDSDAAVSLQRLRMLRPLLIRWAERQSNGRWAFVLPDPLTREIVKIALPDLGLGAVTAESFDCLAAAQHWVDGGDSVGHLSSTAGAID